MAVLKKWINLVPGLGWVALAGLLLAAFWLQQHDVRVRQQVQLQQVQRQTSSEVAALQKQARQAVKQANVESARAVQQLEARRRTLQQQNRQLAAQLTEMRKQAQIQAGRVATLPLSEIVTRVATQLGLQPQDFAAKATSRQSAKAGNKLRMTNDELPKSAGQSADIAKGARAQRPEVTPHPAAGAATLSPRRGLDHASYADIAKNATSAPPRTVQAANGIALALTGSGARKVETALVGLKACRAESTIESQQISNCQARAQADEAAIQRLNGSVASLNQALAAKDKIIRQQAGECQAELRAVRGTFWERLAHLSEHVAVGIGVGVVIGVATR